MIEDFLARWSRRKQTAAQAPEPAPADKASSATQEHPAKSGEPESREASSAAPNAPAPGATAFDPASLPAIDSITAATDIRGFFAAGVPAELTRAALRRVWTADPKIRDFVGLADYDWDFNAPGSMPGFGPIEGSDALRGELARLIFPNAGERTPRALGRSPEAAPGAAPPIVSTEDQSYSGQQNAVTIKAEPSEHFEQSAHKFAAVQQKQAPEIAPPVAHRKHGGALPES